MGDLSDLREAILRLPLVQRAVLADWIAEVTRSEGEGAIAEARGAYIPAERLMTLEEYFAYEAGRAERHEYLNGTLKRTGR